MVALYLAALYLAALPGLAAGQTGAVQKGSGQKGSGQKGTEQKRTEQKGASRLPQLVIDKTLHDFGEVFAGEEIYGTFIVTNTGDAVLELSDKPLLVTRPTVSLYRRSPGADYLGLHYLGLHYLGLHHLGPRYLPLSTAGAFRPAPV